jgi:hypothetical protein
MSAGTSGAETVTGVVSAAEAAAERAAPTSVLSTLLLGPLGGVVVTGVAATSGGINAALGLDPQQQDAGWSWTTIAAVAFFSILVIWLLGKLVHEGAGVAKAVL